MFDAFYKYLYSRESIVRTKFKAQVNNSPRVLTRLEYANKMVKILYKR